MNCQECKSELPEGAHFCIECSAPVAVTGWTERLEAEPSGGSVVPWAGSHYAHWYAGTATVYRVVKEQNGGSADPTYFLREASE